jgi:acyl carrier protein
MSDQEIIEKLQVLLRSVLGSDDIVLTTKTKFQDLGISSFGMVQLVCAIEDEFDIEIPNTVIKSINSVPSAVKFLKKQLKAKI